MGKFIPEKELAARVAKYDSVRELREKDNSTYQLIRRRGLMEKLCSHLKREHRQNLSDDDLSEIALHYDYLKEFQEKDHVTYVIIHKRGLFDKLCGHMKRERTYLLDKELIERASHYDVLKEFRKKDPVAYRAIQDRGLLEKLCSHMKREARLPMSDDDLAGIASGYDVLQEFRESDESAYTIIRKRGLFNKLCGHMKRSLRDLTDDLLEDIALGYLTRDEFQKGDPSAYSTACRRGIIDKICAHMERKVFPVGYWTKERCQMKALDYKSKEEFRKGCPSAHGAAQKNGWLDEICSHMIPKGNWFKRKIYVFTFSDGYAYVGLAQDTEERRRQHLSGKDKKSPVLLHIKETGATYNFDVLTDWLDKSTAAKMEEEYRKKYAVEGWKMLNRIKGGGLGSTIKIYTHERILKEVGKYEYVDDLRKGSPSLYKFILRYHLWDKYCSKMKFRRAPQGYWTLERAIAVVPKCGSRKELHKKYAQAYCVLNKARLLDKYYPKNSSKVTWTLEKSLSIVQQCSSRMELQRKYQRAYNVLLKTGVLDDFFPPLVSIKSGLTDKERISIIVGCKTRREVHDRHPKVYKWAIENGVLDKFFPPKCKKHTEEEKLKILSCCKSRMELRRNHDSVYKWALKNGVIDKYLPKQ